VRVEDWDYSAYNLAQKEKKTYVCVEDTEERVNDIVVTLNNAQVPEGTQVFWGVGCCGVSPLALDGGVVEKA
jgi:hypothetical protein